MYELGALVGAIIWVGGLFLAFVFCGLRWERGWVYRLLPLLYAAVSANGIAVGRGYEGFHFIQFVLGLSATGLIFSGVAWLYAR